MNFYSAIMASRRSKDKQPTTNDDKQLVKHKPASPVEVASRFTTLGIIVNSIIQLF